jgi:hypothetical protein
MTPHSTWTGPRHFGFGHRRHRSQYDSPGSQFVDRWSHGRRAASNITFMDRHKVNSHHARMYLRMDCFLFHYVYLAEFRHVSTIGAPQLRQPRRDSGKQLQLTLGRTCVFDHW